MHYVEEGAGDPVLLLHGEPTWGFLYRRMIPALTRAGRVVVPDLFGFGRSDKPREQGSYSYDRHYGSIERLALELDLRALTLVVHDWGGPIGLRLAVEHPDRVERLVILNTGVGVGRRPSRGCGSASSSARSGPTSPRAGSCRSLRRPLDEEAVRGYDAPFPVREAKAGALAFPELVPTEPDHPSAAAMLQVRDALARWEKPTLVLFSDSDRVFSPAHAERMAAHIPGAPRRRSSPGAGHFLQEDKGEEIADADRPLPGGVGALYSIVGGTLFRPAPAGRRR